MSEAYRHSRLLRALQRRPPVGEPPLFSIQQTYYDNLAQTHGRASECIGCRKCERSCPQHLPIVDDLKRVAATFETAG
ncbi:MAG: 4Fe-4S dicluster domain-containing protein [Alistipes shahii]